MIRYQLLVISLSKNMLKKVILVFLRIEQKIAMPNLFFLIKRKPATSFRNGSDELYFRRLFDRFYPTNRKDPRIVWRFLSRII